METFIALVAGLGVILSLVGCIRHKIEILAFGLMFMGLACVSLPLLQASQKMSVGDQTPAVVLGATLLFVGFLVKVFWMMSRFPYTLAVILLFAFTFTAEASAQSMETVINNTLSFAGLKISSVRLDGDKRIPGPKDIRQVSSLLLALLRAGGAEYTPGRGTRIVGGIIRKEAGSKKGGGLFGAQVSAYSANKQTLLANFTLSRERKYTEQEFAEEAAAKIAETFKAQMPAHLNEVARQRELLGLQPEKWGGL